MDVLPAFDGRAIRLAVLPDKLLQRMHDRHPDLPVMLPRLGYAAEDLDFESDFHVASQRTSSIAINKPSSARLGGGGGG